MDGRLAPVRLFERQKYLLGATTGVQSTRAWGASIASFIVYAGLDLWLRPVAGASVGAIGFFAVILTGYLGGIRAGALAGLVFAPLLFTLGLVAGETPSAFLAHNAAGMLVAGASGPLAGWVGDAQRTLSARARALDAERAFAQHLIEDANAMIVGVDAEGRVRTFNRRAEAGIGRTKAEVIGSLWWETVLPIEKYPQLAEHAHEGKLDASEIPRVFEMPLRHPDGGESLVSWRISPIEKDGQFDGIIAYGTDVMPVRSTDLAALSPVARAVVQELVAALARTSAIGHAAERGVGRSIAAALPAGSVEAHVNAYQAMGLGRLRVRASNGGRLEIAGDDLVEQRLTSHQPTCYIALGFLEGVAESEFGTECLGTEVRCASQGAPRCEFVVRARNAAPRLHEPPTAR